MFSLWLVSVWLMCTLPTFSFMFSQCCFVKLNIWQIQMFSLGLVSPETKHKLHMVAYSITSYLLRVHYVPDLCLVICLE